MIDKLIIKRYAKTLSGSLIEETTILRQRLHDDILQGILIEDMEGEWIWETTSNYLASRLPDLGESYLEIPISDEYELLTKEEYFREINPVTEDAVLAI